MHALFFCPTSLCAWEKAGWDHLFIDSPSSSFGVFISWVLDKLQGEELLNFLGVLWGLCSVRSDVVLSPGCPNIDVTLHGFVKLLVEMVVMPEPFLRNDLSRLARGPSLPGSRPPTWMLLLWGMERRVWAVWEDRRMELFGSWVHGGLLRIGMHRGLSLWLLVLGSCWPETWDLRR